MATLTRVYKAFVVDPQCHVSSVQHLIPNILHQLKTDGREYLACRQISTDHGELFRFDEGADRIQNVPVAVAIRGNAWNRHAGMHAVLCMNLLDEFRETRPRVELRDMKGMGA